ncbi:heavy-metal-associated domain-containing protein [Ktedonospora formicarum]|uniref:HMA domain-containing protein n=1 Tax=Ktedonospora formicarum TaxID=2778364 RepID=A0A8J3HRW9_9CHLR|nr:heavy-metal-associated domain-containing protein [Ktedonospora formicarum]GHO42494.1 hypothetical protein KSX_06570 [Ktedonospora formicarum]
MQETTKLTLPKIGCQGCMNKVTNAITNLPGVEIVQTDVPAKAVVIRYAPEQVTLAQIEGELEKVKHIIGSAEPYTIQA